MDTPILFVEFPQYGPSTTSPSHVRVLVNVHHIIAIIQKNGHCLLRTTHADLDIGCTYEEALVALGMAAEAQQ
jgi:hypothetical protein